MIAQFYCSECERWWVESIKNVDELQFYPMRCERCGQTHTVEYEVIA